MPTSPKGGRCPFHLDPSEPFVDDSQMAASSLETASHGINIDPIHPGR
jgi:hypothetical protein